MNGDYFSPGTGNTFLVRSQDGMAINVGESPAGVNVNIAGAVSIENQRTIESGSCS